jgi:mannose-6-phosphate isomerase
MLERMPAYPLRFTPLFKSMLWGGRRLPGFLRVAAPAEPVGEAWVLSDVDGQLSTVANGALAGRTLREVIAADPAAVFGRHVPADRRFPLLLKFIDARQALSVQVHPDDALAVRLAGPGARGKTEAWVVLDADPATSRIYAGLRPGVTRDALRAALGDGSVAGLLHAFTPSRGDCVFLEAGTVHAIGADILLFEVQQTSDITYRLFDWNRVDATTGRPRELHIEAGLACTDVGRGPVDPVLPERDGDRDRLVRCRYFSLHHQAGDRPMTVGAAGECRVAVCLQGRGRVQDEPIAPGDVLLLPAALGPVTAVPDGPLRLLECGMPAPSAA